MKHLTLATLVMASMLATLAPGCAVAQKENTRVVNAMNAHLTPSTTAGRWAAAPLAFPAALVGLIVDGLIVNPAVVVDDAWHDTVDWLWTPDPDESRFRRAVILPLVVAATPFVWVGDWLWRGLVIGPRQEPEA